MKYLIRSQVLFGFVLSQLVSTSEGLLCWNCTRYEGNYLDGGCGYYSRARKMDLPWLTTDCESSIIERACYRVVIGKINDHPTTYLFCAPKENGFCSEIEDFYKIGDAHKSYEYCSFCSSTLCNASARSKMLPFAIMVSVSISTR